MLQSLQLRGLPHSRTKRILAGQMRRDVIIIHDWVVLGTDTRSNGVTMAVHF